MFVLLFVMYFVMDIFALVMLTMFVMFVKFVLACNTFLLKLFVLLIYLIPFVQ